MAPKPEGQADRIRKQFKHRLVDLDMTQAELAQATGISAATISRILSSKARADTQLSTLITLAEAIECEIVVREKTPRSVSVDQSHNASPVAHESRQGEGKGKSRARKS
jgi:transcriptional regulator with XRE-family HTH domain